MEWQSCSHPPSKPFEIGGKLTFSAPFFQERAGLWCVPSRLAHRHLPPASPAIPRAPPGPQPPRAAAAPGRRGSPCPADPHTGHVRATVELPCPGAGTCPACQAGETREAAAGLLQTPRDRFVGVGEVGSRWILPLESRLRHAELFVNGLLCATTSGLHPPSCFKIHPGRSSHPFPIHLLPTGIRLKWEPPPPVLCLRADRPQTTALGCHWCGQNPTAPLHPHQPPLGPDLSILGGLQPDVPLGHRLLRRSKQLRHQPALFKTARGGG